VEDLVTRMAIISVDGHAKAPRAGYRDYVEEQYRDAFDDWLRREDEAGMPDTGNIKPELGFDAQWDSARRQKDLESQGVVAEVLFPNGLPFQSRRPGATATGDPALDRQARMAYNRWLADFCAETPGRRAGQAVISFDDIDQAVEDIRWAKDHGLGGVQMPALEPGGIFFFDPVLDPVWATCQDVELPISQHGGTGAPAYDPPGFAAIMTLAIEHSFFSGRSLWQMILGGVFDRFPALKLAFVETGVEWIEPSIRALDRRLGRDDDWTGFAAFLQRERKFERWGRDYWADNCHSGISPFTVEQFEGGVGRADPLAPDIEPCVTSDTVMFGVDYPHFESIYPSTRDHVAELADHPDVTEEDLRKILYENAAEVYGFDLTALQPDIERVGFEPSELVGSAAPS
jgi:predicted TIM-barrel fold metal-dependent hydrolase